MHPWWLGKAGQVMALSFGSPEWKTLHCLFSYVGEWRQIWVFHLTWAPETEKSEIIQGDASFTMKPFPWVQILWPTVCTTTVLCVFFLRTSEPHLMCELTIIYYSLKLRWTVADTLFYHYWPILKIITIIIHKSWSQHLQ